MLKAQPLWTPVWSPTSEAEFWGEEERTALLLCQAQGTEQAHAIETESQPRWVQGGVLWQLFKGAVADRSGCVQGLRHSMSSSWQRLKLKGSLVPLILPQVVSQQLLPWFRSVQCSHSVVSISLRPHGLQHARPPCPSPTPGVHPNSCPLSRRCHPTISSSVIPFSSCLQSFPASGSLQMSQLFTSGLQSIGVSYSVSSNCLKLPFGTQSRSWKLEYGYKKQGAEMNLLTDQKEIHRLRKWIYGCQGKW